jgi:hypothetical protein
MTRLSFVLVVGALACIELASPSESSECRWTVYEEILGAAGWRLLETAHTDYPWIVLAVVDSCAWRRIRSTDDFVPWEEAYAVRLRPLVAVKGAPPQHAFWAGTAFSRQPGGAMKGGYVTISVSVGDTVLQAATEGGRATIGDCTTARVRHGLLGGYSAVRAIEKYKASATENAPE